jgi:pimeloyl-ACP methyl ester carboxylesterase
MAGNSRAIAIGLAAALTLGAGTARAGDPYRLQVPLGDGTFSGQQLVTGSFSDEEQCARIPRAVWVVVDGRGDCIRYYAINLAQLHNLAVAVYIHGDRLENQTHDLAPPEGYVSYSPAGIERDLKIWAEGSRAPFLYVARPGTHGSSGDHKQRRRAREALLVNGALDAVKRRHGVERFHIAGHSGGGHVLASLLNMRRDIECAAISAGVVAVHERLQLVNRIADFTGYADYYDPVAHIGGIRRDPPPRIFVIADRGDKRVAYATQALYVRRLKEIGLDPVLFHGVGRGANHHGLSYLSLPVALMCAGDASTREIVDRLTALATAEKGS